MKIGITVGIGGRSESTIAGLQARVEDMERSGFASVWMANAFGFDAITAFVAAGSETASVEIGTAVLGDEAALGAALGRLESAGATDYAAQVISVGTGSAARTVEYLAGR